jgi:hypothetical protein
MPIPSLDNLKCPYCQDHESIKIRWKPDDQLKSSVERWLPSRVVIGGSVCLPSDALYTMVAKSRRDNCGTPNGFSVTITVTFEEGRTN